jgi:hypothetical protein
MDAVIHEAVTHMNNLGSICVIVSVGSFFPYFVAKKFLNLLRKVEIRVVKRAGDLSVEEERLLSQMAVGTRTNLAFSVVCIGYATHVFMRGIWNIIFTPFMMLCVGMSLFLTYICGRLAMRFYRHGRVGLLLFYQCNLFVMASMLCICAVFSFAQIEDVGNMIDSHWDTFTDDIRKKYNDDKQSAIDGTVESLIIIGIIEMYVGMMQVGGIYASRRLYKIKEVELLTNGPSDTDESRHSFSEKVVIGWSIFTGIVAIFWQGEFAVFNQLIKAAEVDDQKPEAEEAQGLWFLAGWKMYAKADGRYESGDSFIVATETFSAICMGPGFLLVAWAVYQHAAYRDVLLVVMCVLHTYSYVLYFSTAIHDRSA